MVDQRLILHIGASKCGSSALQRALSRRPIFKADSGETIAYGALRSGGRFLSGSRVQTAALGTVAGYIQSGPARHIETLSSAQIRAAAAAMRKVRSDRIVLSCEGWLNVPDVFTQSEFIPRIGASAHVMVYVRPQVAFLNSGWWQWGAWGRMPLDRWLDHRLRSVYWARSIAPWTKVPGVEKITVRLLPADIVADFHSVIGGHAEGTDGETLNKGLPGQVLRLYQRHRELRPSSAKSELDFVIAAHLGHFASTPWVISQQQAERIVTETRADNLALKGMLDPASATAMETDPRWWSAQAFAERPLEPAEPVPPDAVEADRLCVALATALLGLAKENAKLQRSIAESGGAGFLTPMMETELAPSDSS